MNSFDRAFYNESIALAQRDEARDVARRMMRERDEWKVLADHWMFFYNGMKRERDEALLELKYTKQILSKVRDAITPGVHDVERFYDDDPATAPEQ